MPNPLGRRRGGENQELSQLKKELEDLKASYARDISLIGSDIRDLDSRIPTDTSASGTPAA